MLTIPETIKNLYKSEAARKNFRVHFPGGEMPDITNENIAQESVRFTESLSSQDVFKFGLAEASTLEFETIGIGNMYGMTIEASIEIDTSSLTAAEIAEIESDPGDGALVAETMTAEWETGDISRTTGENITGPIRMRTKDHLPLNGNSQVGVSFELASASYAYAVVYFYDSEYAFISAEQKTKSQATGRLTFDEIYTAPQNSAYFRAQMTKMETSVTFKFPDQKSYSIPLGRFRVDKCPRNHGSMARRQVRAYTESLGENLKLSPTERPRFHTWARNATMKLSLFKHLLANLAYRSPNIMDEAGYTKSLVSTFSDMSISTRAQGVVCAFYKDGVRYQIERYGTNNKDRTLMLTKNSLYSLDLDGLNIKDFTKYIKDKIKEYDLDWTTVELEGNRPAPATIDEFILEILFQFIPSAAGYYAGFENPAYVFHIPLTEDAACFYTGGSDILAGNLYLPEAFEIGFSQEGIGKLNSYVFDIGDANPTVYAWTKQNENDPEIEIAPTASTVVTYASKQYTLYQYKDALDYAKLTSGYVEIYAMFLSALRTGTVGFRRLTNESQILILPENYAEMWWDEFDVEPIGTISVTYQETTENGDDQSNTVGIGVGSGASHYDMSDNETLKLINGSLSSITEFLMASFVPHLDAVTFTPIELTMQGWPWIEAGDALQITAEDGTIVRSYALRVEMSGIQHLQMVITAEGGEISEEVA